MERFRRASVVSAIGSGAGVAGRAHLGSAGSAAAAPEAVALGEPEPEPEPPLTRAERRSKLIYAAVMIRLGALSMTAAHVCVSAAGVTAGGGPQRGGQERPESASQAGFAHESREVGFATRF